MSLQRPRHWMSSHRLAVGVALALVAVLAIVLVVQAASIGTYDQCANDTGSGYPASDPDPGCHWINGNLNHNNSLYVEGDATVQRVWLTDLSDGNHTITLQYGTTKGGLHAYDFLTTWNWSENWITDADLCQDITGGCTTVGASTLAIPQDPNAAGFDLAARFFTMWNGTLASASTPTIVSGTYAGDSETQIVVTFHVDHTTMQGCTATGCPVALWFGAHVAAAANWGPNSGASSVSGSPYHVALAAMDGAAVGQRDNQMQSGVVPANGTIVIVKKTLPLATYPGFLFAFNFSGGTIAQQFNLDTDPATAAPTDTKSFSVPPGVIFTTVEASPPVPFSLTGLTCKDSLGNNVGTVSVVNRTASVTVQSNQTVTCTFTNSITTKVKLSSLSATRAAGGVVVKWATASGVDNAGFNVYRAKTAKGARTQLNAQLIPTNLPPGSPAGSTYSYVDTTVKHGTIYYYWVEGVDIQGGKGLFGPVRSWVK